MLLFVLLYDSQLDAAVLSGSMLARLAGNYQSRVNPRAMFPLIVHSNLIAIHLHMP